MGVRRLHGGNRAGARLEPPITPVSRDDVLGHIADAVQHVLNNDLTPSAIYLPPLLFADVAPLDIFYGARVFEDKDGDVPEGAIQVSHRE